MGLRKLDPDALARAIEDGDPLTSTVTSADDAADQLNDFLVKICDVSMPRVREGQRNRRSVHWWNNEISELRCNLHLGEEIVSKSAEEEGTNWQYRRARELQRSPQSTADRYSQVP